MKFRFYITLLFFFVFLLFVVYLSETPSKVSIQWQDTLIETNVAVLAVILFLSSLVLFYLLRIWHWVVLVPSRIKGYREKNKTRKGYDALKNGLFAIMTGNKKEAVKYEKEAKGYLKENPLAKLLSAQTALLNKDDEKAQEVYSNMIEHQDTSFYGYQGLLQQALKENNVHRALAYARKAEKIQPKTKWVAEVILNLQARLGHWDQAIITVQRKMKLSVFSKDEGKKHLAVLYYKQATESLNSSKIQEAILLLQKSHQSDPSFTNASCKLAELLRQQQDIRQAVKVLEGSWRRFPHSDLFKAYMGLYEDAKPLQKVKRVKDLIVNNKHHYESYIALADVNLSAELWGEARASLSKAIELNPDDARSYLLMAKIEKSEFGDHGTMLETIDKWKEKAKQATMPQWNCSKCNSNFHQWSILCPACASFNSYSWGHKKIICDDVVTVSSTSPENNMIVYKE